MFMNCAAQMGLSDVKQRATPSRGGAFRAQVLPAAKALSQPGVDYREAVAFYEAVLKTQPDRYAWAGRGFALLKLGRYEEAVASYDRALAFCPDQTAWCNRGHALCRLGRYPEALASYNHALEIDPDFDAAFYGKASAYALQAELELALDNLRQAIALSPNEYRAMVKLDPDFDRIRVEVQFQQLVNQPLEETGLTAEQLEGVDLLEP